MPSYVFQVQPSGREVRVTASSERAGRRKILDYLAVSKPSERVSVQCIDVEPLACVPAAPVIDPFEDLPVLKARGKRRAVDR